jgi:drug/metabolite transporter (DMT)-like permease
MKSFYLPILLVIGGGALYHIAQKSIPKDANPLAALVIAYLTSLAAVLLCLALFPADNAFIVTLKRTNWAMFAVGIGAAAIEIGFLFAYRVGWNISLTALLTNVAIAVILIPIGLGFFKESLSLWNLLGILLCILGLLFISKR